MNKAIEAAIKKLDEELVVYEYNGNHDDESAARMAIKAFLDNIDIGDLQQALKRVLKVPLPTQGFVEPTSDKLYEISLVVISHLKNACEG